MRRYPHRMSRFKTSQNHVKGYISTREPQRRISEFSMLLKYQLKKAGRIRKYQTILPNKKGGNDYRAKDKEKSIRQDKKDPMASRVLCGGGTGTKRKHRRT